MGATTTHIDDILGCGESGTMANLRAYLAKRCGAMKIQDTTCTHVGAEISQSQDFPFGIAQEVFAGDLQLLLTATELWNRRQRNLDPEEVLTCQCELGDVCWVAAVSLPDICARPAVLVAKVSYSQRSDAYRINDLIRTAKQRQGRVILSYSSKLDIGNICMAGWSAAAN